MKRAYSADERDTAIAVYAKLGLHEAARQTQIPKGTISSWAARSGLHAPASSATERTAAATEARTIRIAEKRDELREELILAALHHVKASTETKGRDASGHAVAAGIFVDKFRLESGEASGVFQQLTKQQAIDDGKARAVQLRPVREAS